jgi:hypothetical protein
MGHFLGVAFLLLSLGIRVVVDVAWAQGATAQHHSEWLAGRREMI